MKGKPNLTLQQVVSWVKEKHSVDISTATVSLWLNDLGLSYKQLRKGAYFDGHEIHTTSSIPVEPSTAYTTTHTPGNSDGAGMLSCFFFFKAVLKGLFLNTPPSDTRPLQPIRVDKLVVSYNYNPIHELQE